MKIKFAVIGCGSVGSKHIDLIKKNKNCELVSIIDISKKKLDYYKLKKILKFQSIRKFLNSSPTIDVAIIATPNGLHASQALDCLKNGMNVVIEKPMSLNSKDAKKIIEMEKQSKKKVFVVMQNRFSPPSVWLKKIISNRIIGKIYFIKLDCFWNRDARYYKNHPWHGKRNLDGGTLFTQFSHFIDIIYWLFGDIKSSKSFFYNFNHKKLTQFEDSGSINFKFINNIQGILNFSTSVFDKNLESTLTIIGEKGTVKVGGQYMEKLVYCNIANYKTPILRKSSPSNDYGAYKGSANNHKYIIKNIVDVLNNKSKIATTSLDGYKVVRIIERFYKNDKK